MDDFLKQFLLFMPLIVAIATLLGTYLVQHVLAMKRLRLEKIEVILTSALEAVSDVEDLLQNVQRITGDAANNHAAKLDEPAKLAVKAFQELNSIGVRQEAMNRVLKAECLSLIYASNLKPFVSEIGSLLNTIFYKIHRRAISMVKDSLENPELVPESEVVEEFGHLDIAIQKFSLAVMTEAEAIRKKRWIKT